MQMHMHGSRHHVNVVFGQSPAWNHHEPRRIACRATPAADEQARRLHAFFQDWEAKHAAGKGVDQETGKPLMSEELRCVHARVLALTQAGYCTDPLPTEQMYYVDAKGKLRTLRSSSQLESRHRFMNAELPGYHMGVETAHASFVAGSYRHLVNSRALTRSTEFQSYPTFRHDLLQKVNQTAVRAAALGVSQPFPGISVGLHGVSEADYVGGLKSLPVAQQRQAQQEQQVRQAASQAEQHAQQATQVAPAVERGQQVPQQAAVPAAGEVQPDALQQATQAAQRGQQTRHATGADQPMQQATRAALQAQQAGPSQPMAQLGLSPKSEAAMLGRKAAGLRKRASRETNSAEAAALEKLAADAEEAARQRLAPASELAPAAPTDGDAAQRPRRPAAALSVAAAVASASPTKRRRIEPVQPASPASQQVRAARSVPSKLKFRRHVHPIKDTYPLDVGDESHVELFLSLLPAFSSDGGHVDYKGLAVAYNVQQHRQMLASCAGTLRPTHERFVKDFHTAYRRALNTQLSLEPPPAELAAAEQTAPRTDERGSGALGTLGGALLSLFSRGRSDAAPPTIAAQGKNQGGKGVSKCCQGCRYLAAVEVPAARGHKLNCKYAKQFAALSPAEQRKLRKRS